jgi:hypothetical protein
MACLLQNRVAIWHIVVNTHEIPMPYQCPPYNGITYNKSISMTVPLETNKRNAMDVFYLFHQ